MKDQQVVAPVARQVHPFLLVKEDGTVASFDSTEVVRVAWMLRHAANVASRVVSQDAEFIEHFVCGHSDADHSGTRRLSYAPLPSIGSALADGRIRRALIVEPYGEREPLANNLIGALYGATLQDQQGKASAVMRAALSNDSMDTLNGYVASSTTWGSVTPMLLPGRDDHKSGKARKLVHAALQQAGYDTPVTNVQVQVDPIFAGTGAANSYALPPETEHLRQWPRMHVVITFAERVNGLLLIGSGRHYGLGLFAAL